jgi:hypothetical protein
VPLPHGGKIARRMVIEVIDPSDDQAVIDADEPSPEKSSRSSSGNNHLEMRQDKSLGGELQGLSIW